MANIYKYKLEMKPIQQVRCKAVKILDIQMQNGVPTLWAVTDSNVEEATISIILQGTGTDRYEAIKEFEHIATIQDGVYVWHWFTDFGFNYDETD